MFKNFIHRPVLAIAVSLVLCFLGALSIESLPVSQYPEVAPPLVMVTIAYPGASANVLVDSTLIPTGELKPVKLQLQWFPQAQFCGYFAAKDKGYFKDQVVPVELKTRKGTESFTTEEHVRKGLKIEDLQKLRPAFKKDGTVTAGNASGLNDAGAAIVMCSSEYAKQNNLKPLARLVAYSHAGVEPQVMGLGPIPAVKRLFEKTGHKPADMDVVESNEAFAAQAMAVTKDLGLDPAKVNPNGGAVALGHPIGATGAILTVKALYELARTQKRYALVTMCIGGGQGIAAVFERL